MFICCHHIGPYGPTYTPISIQGICIGQYWRKKSANLYRSGKHKLNSKSKETYAWYMASWCSRIFFSKCQNANISFILLTTFFYPDKSLARKVPLVGLLSHRSHHLSPSLFYANALPYLPWWSLASGFHRLSSENYSWWYQCVVSAVEATQQHLYRSPAPGAV